MPLLLPNLDDRTWADLVAESTSLIPVYGPEWTDQNYSDPGITIVELLAAVAEMDIYQLNQISDEMRRAFLALVGVAPRPPRPAHAVLSFALTAAASPITLPESLELCGLSPSGTLERYRILRSLTLAPGNLVSLQCQDATGYQDLTPLWQRRSTMSPFGTAPQPGSEFYLGLSSALPVNQTAQFYFTFADGHSSFEDRERLNRQQREREKRCQPPVYNPCEKKTPPTEQNPPAKKWRPLMHYGVRTVWEYLTTIDGQLQWTALDPSEQAVDDTRSFTLDGAVTLRVPGPMAQASIGAVSQPYYYVRCRFDAGRYDAAPVLRDVAFNAVVAEQAVPAEVSLTIAPGAAIAYGPQGPPKPNDVTALTLKLDEQSRVVQITFGGGNPGDPEFRILSFQPSSAGMSGALSLEAVFAGFGSGFPNQQVALPDPPVKTSGLRLHTLEDDGWHAWHIRPDLYASTRTDFHAVLDATGGVLRFGDGEHGRVPPLRCLIFVSYLSTAAEAGNLGPKLINQLADSPHNRAVTYDPAALPDGWTKLNGELAAISNPLPACGGAAAQTVTQAAGRADQLVENSGRAVTLADYERLALQTPGTRVARVTAIPNVHPDFPCYKAPGIVTVIVLPYLPKGRPAPTPGLLNAVAAYIRPRRIIGTRVEVVAPTYLEVTVQANVQSAAGTNRATLQQAIVAAISDFFDPLTGGPNGTGWPFGRDVYRSEIMRVIDEVPGVDFVSSLTLLSGCGQAQCGNVCLGPTWLVASGAHQITVL